MCNIKPLLRITTSQYSSTHFCSGHASSHTQVKRVSHEHISSVWLQIAIVFTNTASILYETNSKYGQKLITVIKNYIELLCAGREIVRSRLTPMFSLIISNIDEIKSASVVSYKY